MELVAGVGIYIFFAHVLGECTIQWTVHAYYVGT